MIKRSDLKWLPLAKVSILGQPSGVEYSSFLLIQNGIGVALSHCNAKEYAQHGLRELIVFEKTCHLLGINNTIEPTLNYLHQALAIKRVVSDRLAPKLLDNSFCKAGISLFTHLLVYLLHYGSVPLVPFYLPT